MPMQNAKRSTVQVNEYLRKENCYSILDVQPPLKKLKMIETNGICRTSILNELSFFKTMKNYSVDIMHDALEGFASLAMKYMFEFLIEKKNIFKYR